MVIVGNHPYCAFCREVIRIGKLDLPFEDEDRLINELFDRADRCRKIRQAYGRKHGR